MHSNSTINVRSQEHFNTDIHRAAPYLQNIRYFIVVYHKQDLLIFRLQCIPMSRVLSGKTKFVKRRKIFEERFYNLEIQILMALQK